VADAVLVVVEMDGMTSNADGGGGPLPLHLFLLLFLFFRGMRRGVVDSMSFPVRPNRVLVSVRLLDTFEPKERTIIIQRSKFVSE